MHLRLRTEFLKKCIEAHGGQAIVLRRANLERTTLWRWLQKGLLPNDPKHLLHLASALDLDPALLFDLEPEFFSRLCGRVIGLVRTGNWASFLPALSFVEPLIVPSVDWPPAELAPGTPCHWHCSRFAHHPEQGAHYYAPLVVSPASRQREPRAQVWYFAYRNIPGERPYIPWGLVCLVGDSLELYNYDGTTKRSSLSNERFVVETWFGGGAAEFCVASVHPFNLSVERSVPAQLPVVRFD